MPNSQESTPVYTIQVLGMYLTSHKNILSSEFRANVKIDQSQVQIDQSQLINYLFYLFIYLFNLAQQANILKYWRGTRKSTTTVVEAILR